MSALVEVRDLAKVFDVSAPWLNRVIERKPRQYVHAVDGISFTIERGRTLALVGESGCGKSTVARLLVGLYGPSAGSVTFDGQDTTSTFASPQALTLRRRMQMIFQDPYASLNPRWKVRDIIAEPMREHALLTDDNAIHERVGELLQSVGLARRGRAEIPPPVLRRPAPAHLDCPGAGHPARVSGLRRAHLGTRCVGPGPGPEHHEGPAAQPGPDLPVHLAQPGGRAPRGRRGRRHVPRPPGRGRPQGPALQRPAASLHAHAARCDPRHPHERPRPQPGASESPTPLTPPTGCTFHPRCPHANARCSAERPVLIHRDGLQVACHAVEEGRI